MICLNEPAALIEQEGPEAIAYLPETVIADINVSPAMAAHKAELIYGARARYHLGILRQRQQKTINDRIERAHVEGLGRQVASFDPAVFLQLEKVRGRGWWRNRSELMKFLAENPMFAIRVNAGYTNGKNFSVRVNGFRDERAATPRPEAEDRYAMKPVDRRVAAPSVPSNSRRLEVATR